MTIKNTVINELIDLLDMAESSDIVPDEYDNDIDKAKLGLKVIRDNE